MSCPSAPSANPSLDKENQGNFVNARPRRNAQVPKEDKRQQRKATQTHATPPTKKFCKEQSQWDQRLEELKGFKQDHGHCNVPYKYIPNPPLGHWVRKQRVHYRFQKQGTPSNLTPDRAATLDELGFVWEPRDEKWDQRFEELKAFQEEQGHCNIPQRYVIPEPVCVLSYSAAFISERCDVRFSSLRSRYKLNLPLGAWVSRQRAVYKAFQEDGAGPMTSDRATALENLGFVWNVVTLAQETRCNNQVHTASQELLSSSNKAQYESDNATHPSPVQPTTKVEREKREVWSDHGDLDSLSSNAVVEIIAADPETKESLGLIL